MARKIKKIQHPVNRVQYIVTKELREQLKPIVFFDSGGALMNQEELLIDFHPHSGVGIITYIPHSELHHQDSDGNSGIIPEGGVQWMLAGRGLWHREAYRSANIEDRQKPWNMFIHQLWLQMPPVAEEKDVEYLSVRPEDIPRLDNVKVIAGDYKEIRGRVNPPLSLTYLDIHLEPHSTWKFQPPEGQTKGIICSRNSSVQVAGTNINKEPIGIFEENNEPIIISSGHKEVDFIIIIAEPSSHLIVAAQGSMHTSQEALKRSLERINTIRPDNKFKEKLK